MARDQANRYLSAFHSMEEGFCMIRILFDAQEKAVDYVFLDANAAFEAQTGIQGAKGKRMREIAPAHEEQWLEMYGHIARTGISRRFAIPSPQGDRWYEGYAYRVGSATDEIGILLRDVTEQTRTEKELEDTKKTLEQGVAMRAKELAVSQEQVRGLAAELTLAEQRERKRLATELHEDLAERLVVARLKLGQLEQNALLDGPSEELLMEVDKILLRSLAYTRTLVSDLSPLVLQDLGLPAAVKWLAERMQQQGLAVTVRTTVPEELALPQAHAVFLLQSVRELLMNTLKHARCRGASVVMTMPPGHVQIEVQDDGVGFISEPAESSTAPSASGLSSIRQRMNALEGTFEIESSQETGTRATLRLPLRQSTIAESQQSGNDVRQASSSKHHKNGGGIIHVLLVDDHAMVRQGLKSVLDAYADIKVVGEAADGEAAVTLTTELSPAVVLMDINMPACNGIEATRRITARYPHIRVIGLSVNADGPNQEAMLKAGAYSLMTKEAAVEQLYTLIYQAVKPGVVPFSPLR